jgi:hypothetical protein
VLPELGETYINLGPAHWSGKKGDHPGSPGVEAPTHILVSAELLVVMPTNATHI